LENARRIADLTGRLDNEIPETLAQLGIPGLAVGICDSEKILWAAGFGTTEQDAGTAVTTSTRFSLQSTSKLFTATLILDAVEDGLVDLDEPISTYIPEFRVRSVFDERPEQLITLRHLLSHTAGLTHEAPIGSNFDFDADDFDEHCQSIFTTWLRFPVGHHHEYSNLGIDLAGYILQRLAGSDFRRHAEKTLFDPLGLTRSTFDARVFANDDERAVGHWTPFTAAGLPLPTAVPMVAAGGLYSCLDDVLRFVQFQLRGGEGLIASRLLTEQRTMQFPLPGQSLGHGLALYIDEWAPGVRVLHHGGSGFGFQVQLWWLPEHGFGGAVLTNSFDHNFQNELAARITEDLVDADRTLNGDRDRAADVPAPASDESDADRLLGEYVGRLDDRRLVRDGTRLEMHHRGAVQPVRLIGSQAIEVTGSRVERFVFTGDGDGEPRYLHSLRDGQTWYRNSVDTSSGLSPKPPPTGTYVATFQGIPLVWYRLDHDGEVPVIERVRVAGEASARGIRVRLRPISADLHLSAVGEVLDLSSANPRYANVELTEADDE
jgi:CubicO group peptidase (beta-lactamase class C family)